ncbi:hypothetical protein GCM10010399_21820 [Dactylosporangium fulvum]
MESGPLPPCRISIGLPAPPVRTVNGRSGWGCRIFSVREVIASFLQVVGACEPAGADAGGTTDGTDSSANAFVTHAFVVE